MTKGGNRSGSDKAKRDAALLAKGKVPNDRGGKNLGIGNEHSRVPNGEQDPSGPDEEALTRHPVRRRGPTGVAGDRRDRPPLLLQRCCLHVSPGVNLATGLGA